MPNDGVMGFAEGAREVSISLEDRRGHRWGIHGGREGGHRGVGDTGETTTQVVHQLHTEDILAVGKEE